MSSSSNLIDVLRARADATPEARCLIYLTDGECQEVALTNGAVDRQARTIAAYLQQCTHPGDRAMMLFAPGPEPVAAFFGALYAGLIAVPVQPPRQDDPPGELLAFAADAAPTVLLTTSRLASALGPLLAAEPFAGVTVVAVDAIAADPEDWAPPRLPSEAIATLLYTSGSTARPRGVMMGHEMLLRWLAVYEPYYQRTNAYGPLVSWAPLHHLTGLLAAVVQPINVGVMSVVLSPMAFVERPVRWLRAITRYQGSLSVSPNFGYQACVDGITSEERDGLDLRSWRLSFTGSEAIRVQTMRDFVRLFAPYGFREEVIVVAYGQSEVCAATLGDPQSPLRTVEADRVALAEGRVVNAASGDVRGQTLVACGKPLPGLELLIVDPDTRTKCPPDTVGEVWLRGSLVTPGYWNRPEETAAVFHATLASGEGPYLRTGDLGFVRDGELYITGRLKEMIIVRGRNVYAVDIEETAEKAHDALRPAASAAFSVPVDGEEQLVLLHELRPEAGQVDVDAVAAAVRRAVGVRHQLPVHTVALVAADSLPRTRNGKLQRYRCKAMFIDSQTPSSDS